MQETYTFSRALHLMRYGGKKMACVLWRRGYYIEVIDTYIIDEYGASVELNSEELLGSWVEVK